LERHKDIANLVFLGYLAFMEVGCEILDELREDRGRDVTGCQNGSRFVAVVKFDSSHVVKRWSVGGRRHSEAIVFGGVGRCLVQGGE
jgi:hypothetical protein